MPQKDRPQDLPITLALGLPCAVLSLVYITSALGYAQWLRSESGAVEVLTVIFLILAVLYFASIAWTLPLGITRGWFVLLLLGAFYFAGEEMSWGQFLIGWQTPEGWQAINDQGETNIHNTWSGFDQVPRIALTLAAAIGGIAAPVYRYFRQIPIPPVTEIQGWLPTLVCTPTCLLAIIVSPLDDFNAQSAVAVLQSIGEISGGEFKECLLALFIMLYALSAQRRIKSVSMTS